jgi:hypothetical protein
MSTMKSYSVKSNAKRFAKGLAAKYPGFTVCEPAAADNGEWFPALLPDNGAMVPAEVREVAVIVTGVGPRAECPEVVDECELPADAEGSELTAHDAEARRNDTLVDAAPVAQATSADSLQIPAVKKARTPRPTQQQPKARDGSKREAIAALLLREEGCTTQDILDATGWPTVTVPGQAAALGIKLRKVKEGRATRYFGTR